MILFTTLTVATCKLTPGAGWAKRMLASGSCHKSWSLLGSSLEKVQAVRDDVEEVGTGVCGNTTATVVISGFLLRLAFYCFGV